jgi:hypothetical protein
LRSISPEQAIYKCAFKLIRACPPNPTARSKEHFDPPCSSPPVARHSVMVAIPIPEDKIAEFCRRNHIRKLALFGSVLTDEFQPDSDVDVLVEFEPGQTPGYEFIDMQDELSKLLGGRNVDLVTQKFLNWRIRPQVLSQAKVVYAEG